MTATTDLAHLYVRPRRIATVSAASLRKAVSLVTRVTKGRNYEHEWLVRFRVEANRIHMAASDGLNIESWCAAATDAEHDVCVNGKDLAAALKGQTGEIPISYAPAAGEKYPARLSLGDFAITISEDEPYIPDDWGCEVHWDLLASDLAAAITGIAPAISKEESRYYLTGGFFDSDGMLAATDGYKLHTYQLPGCPAGWEGVIVPDRTLQAWAAALKQCPKDSVVTLSMAHKDGAKGTQLLCDAARITGKAIDGAYPNYKNAIPETSNRTELSWPIDRIAAFATGVDSLANSGGISGFGNMVTVQFMYGNIWLRGPGHTTEAVNVGGSVPDGFQGSMGFTAGHLMASKKAGGSESAKAYLAAPEDGAIREKMLIRKGPLDIILVPNRG